VLSIGGSNLVPYFGDYYIGGAHSRLYIANPLKHGEEKSFHFTHLVVLDVRHWKVVHVTRPLLYDTKRFAADSRYCIQDPISIIRADDIYYSVVGGKDVVATGTRAIANNPESRIPARFLATVNVADVYSLAYELTVATPKKEIIKKGKTPFKTGKRTVCVCTHPTGMMIVFCL
jgi:hypothetical protein